LKDANPLIKLGLCKNCAKKACLIKSSLDILELKLIINEFSLQDELNEVFKLNLTQLNPGHW